MNLFDQMATYRHEQLVFCSDKAVNLKAIIAIHDTTLGPAMGGTRMFPYESEEAAIFDVLRLSQAMTYKNSAAGLNLGGGKAVIIGDPAKDKSSELLRSYGRFVNSLNGRYITAGDMGTTVDDLQQIQLETTWVCGLPISSGGGGDTAPLTALGVLCGMKACAKEVFGSNSLNWKVVAIQGMGKCGYHLAKLLHEEGARLIVADVNAELAKKVADELGATIVAPDQVYSVACDIFSPCAVGAILNDKTISRLKCKIVAGAANNQLAVEYRDNLALDRLGIMYAPDYIVNAGGAINISFEVARYDAKGAKAKVAEIYNTMEKVISIAKSKDIPTIKAAHILAEERIEKKRKSTSSLGKHHPEGTWDAKEKHCEIRDSVPSA